MSRFQQVHVFIHLNPADDVSTGLHWILRQDFWHGDVGFSVLCNVFDRGLVCILDYHNECACHGESLACYRHAIFEKNEKKHDIARLNSVSTCVHQDAGVFNLKSRVRTHVPWFTYILRLTYVNYEILCMFIRDSVLFDISMKLTSKNIPV